VKSRLTALTEAEKLEEYRRAGGEVLVDMDGTLCEFKYPDMGLPVPGAREFMLALRARGLRPIIWSSRMSPEIYTEEERARAVMEIGKWAAQHGIHYYGIDTGNSGKRLCMAYVDDRGVHAGGDWDLVLDQIDDIQERVESSLQRKRGSDEVGDRH
jgi:hypothetical protein